jgi:hypothetical protein
MYSGCLGHGRPEILQLLAKVYVFVKFTLKLELK